MRNYLYFGHCRQYFRTALEIGSTTISCAATIFGFVLPVGPEPGASCQPAEGEDAASERAVGEAEAAGQCGQGGSETSNASSETAS